MAGFDLEHYLVHCRDLTNKALDDALYPGGDGDPGRLREGMRYAVLNGGKRMRPVVTIATCEACGGTPQQALPGCCSLEMVHAYSLVHDDLPAMDDDSERRGKPTVHVAFGEGPAILIGDALLTRAFEVLATGEAAYGPVLAQAVVILAREAGIDGMVGGQALDMQHGQGITELGVLEQVHARKTGALYAAGGAMGALLAGAEPKTVEAMRTWGLKFGIAFQHADDVLDDDQVALRPQALARVDELVAECNALAESFGDKAAALRALAGWVQKRAHTAAAGDLAQD